jgi:hypothetical protein
MGFEVDAVLFSLAYANMFLQSDGRANMIFRSSLIGDKNEAILSNKDLLTTLKASSQQNVSSTTVVLTVTRRSFLLLVFIFSAFGITLKI